MLYSISSTWKVTLVQLSVFLFKPATLTCDLFLVMTLHSVTDVCCITDLWTVEYFVQHYNERQLMFFKLDSSLLLENESGLW